MPEDPDRVGEYVDVGGVRVFFRSAGSGEPIILLHGFPTSSYDWREVIGPFSKFGRVLAPDLYGHGYSGMPPGGNLLGFLPGFLSAMSIDNFRFVGYDAGGYMGLAYAVANPTRVDRLVIMNAPAYPNWIGHARTSPRYAPLRRMMTNPPYRWLGLAMMNTTSLQRLLTAPSGATMLPEDLALQLQFIKRGIRGLVQMRPRPYTEPFFEAVEGAMAWLARGVQDLIMPTLLIFGRDDPYIPTDTPGRLHEDIKDSNLHLLDRTGHFLMEQRPKEIASLISPFLSG